MRFRNGTAAERNDTDFRPAAKIGLPES